MREGLHAETGARMLRLLLLLLLLLLPPIEMKLLDVTGNDELQSPRDGPTTNARLVLSFLH